MTIEKLEALEKAATSPQWDRDVRAALGNLLAVAKAAKALRATDSKGDWCPMTEQAMDDRERFTAELDEAISRLEAQ